MIDLAVALDTDGVSPSWNSCCTNRANPSAVEYSPGANFWQTFRARVTALLSANDGSIAASPRSSIALSRTPGEGTATGAAENEDGGGAAVNAAPVQVELARDMWALAPAAATPGAEHPASSKATAVTAALSDDRRPAHTHRGQEQAAPFDTRKPSRRRPPRIPPVRNSNCPG